MAEKIEIVITESGGRVVKASLAEIGKIAKGTATDVNTLQATLKTLSESAAAAQARMAQTIASMGGPGLTTAQEQFLAVENAMRRAAGAAESLIAVREVVEQNTVALKQMAAASGEAGAKSATLSAEQKVLAAQTELLSTALAGIGKSSVTSVGSVERLQAVLVSLTTSATFAEAQLAQAAAAVGGPGLTASQNALLQLERALKQVIVSAAELTIVRANLGGVELATESLSATAARSTRSIGAMSSSMSTLSAESELLQRTLSSIGGVSSASVAGLASLRATLDHLASSAEFAQAKFTAAMARMGGPSLSPAQAQLLETEASLRKTVTAAEASAKAMVALGASSGSIQGVTTAARAGAGAVGQLAASYGVLSTEAELASIQMAKSVAAMGGPGLTARQEAVLAAQAASLANFQKSIALGVGGSGTEIEGYTRRVQALGNVAATTGTQLTAMSAEAQLASAQMARTVAAMGGPAVTKAQEAALAAQQSFARSVALGIGGAGTKIEGLSRARQEVQSLGRAASITAGQLATMEIGAQKAARGIAFLERSIFSLKNLIAVFIAHEIVQMADDFRNLQNRLRVVTTSEAELASTTQALFEISQRTRTGIKDTAETYSRLAFNTRSLGISQLELLKITETLNQALVVGGAREQEGQNALIQLSQAFATGRLRADEFRAVTEQLPVVADALAKHFKVTRGELLQLSIQGKITSEEMVKAFREAAPEIEQRFAQTVPTVEQSLTRLKNAAVIAFGEINESSGISTGFGKFVQFITKDMEKLKLAFEALAVAVTGFIATKVFEILIHALIAFVGFVTSATTKVLAFFAGFQRLILLTRTTAGLIALRASVVALLIPLGVLAETLLLIAGLATIAITIKLTIEEPKAMGKAALAFLGNLFGGGTGPDFGKAAIAATMEFNTTAAEENLKRINAEMKKLNDERARFEREFEGPIPPAGLFPEKPSAEFLKPKIGSDLLEIIEQIKSENELLKLGNDQRTIGEKLLAAQNKVNRQLNDAEKELLTTLLSENIQLERRNKIRSAVEEIEKENQLLTLSNEERQIALKLLQLEKQAGGAITGEFRKRVIDAVELNRALEQTNKLQDDWKKMNEGLQLDRQVEEIEKTVSAAEGLTEAVRRGNIERELSTAVLEEQRNIGRALRDDEVERLRVLLAQQRALQSSGELRRIEQQLSAENRVAGLPPRDAEIARSLLGIEEQLLEKGELLEQSSRQRIEYILIANRALQEQAEILEDIKPPDEKFREQWLMFFSLLRFGLINLQQFADAINALEDTKIENTFLGGLRAGLREVQDEVRNFGENIKNWVVGSFEAAADAIVEFARTGELNIRKLASIIVEELLRIATMRLFAQLIGFIPGFQHGGSFTVGGSGGPDSQMVAFMGTPGERVDVRTPQQQQQQDRKSERAVNFSIINVTDPNQIYDALQTVDGERVILNVLENNPNLIRRAMGAA